MTIRAYLQPRFAPLPAPRANRVRWAEVANKLHERPGEWAAVAEVDRRQGLRQDGYAAHGLEATTRSNGDGTFTIWARSLGKPEATTRQPRPTTRWSWGRIVAVGS